MNPSCVPISLALNDSVNLMLQLLVLGKVRTQVHLHHHH